MNREEIKATIGFAIFTAAGLVLAAEYTGRMPELPIWTAFWIIIPSCVAFVVGVHIIVVEVSYEKLRVIIRLRKLLEVAKGGE